MPSAAASFRHWFDLARAGNFPSVASNVLAALVLSSAAAEGAFPSAGLLTLTIIAGCLVYAGGATFNDVADAAFDARHRPERAIPRGLITRAGAAWMAGAEMAVGLGLLIAAGASVAWSLALAATILVYDWIHKRWIGSVVLMAGCRVLLACAIASLPGHAMSPAFLWWVGALFVYIASLTLIARWEYKVAATPDRGSDSLEADSNVKDSNTADANDSAVGDRSRRAIASQRIGRAVGRLLAFIPLIDAIALLLIGAWLPALACALAVPAGRWAQRVAAST